MCRDDTLHLPGGGGIHVQIRPTVAQLEIIDNIMRGNGLNSRSQRVAATLNEFLPGRKTADQTRIHQGPSAAYPGLD